MAKFKTVVKRSKWLRGTGGGNLLDGRDLKCCLGFRCEQAGVKKIDLLDVGMPWELEDYSHLDKWLTQVSVNCSVQEAAIVNDDLKIGDAQRETKLKRIFAEQGEEIEFID